MVSICLVATMMGISQKMERLWLLSIFSIEQAWNSDYMNTLVIFFLILDTRDAIIVGKSKTWTQAHAI